MKVIRVALLLMVFVSTACVLKQKSPDIHPTPTLIPSSTTPYNPTPTPSPTPRPQPTTILTILQCSDIVWALKEGGSVWSEFSVSSIGAPIQFTGYVFELDTEKDLISVYSDECNIEIWLKGIPHSTVIYTSYTQIVNGSGTIEGYPDVVYMDEVLVNVDLNTLEIH